MCIKPSSQPTDVASLRRQGRLAPRPREICERQHQLALSEAAGVHPTPHRSDPRGPRRRRARRSVTVVAPPREPDAPQGAAALAAGRLRRRRGATRAAALRAVAARVWSPALTALALSVAVLLIRGAPWPGVLAHLDGDGDAADREVVLSILTVVAEEVTSPSSRISAAPASVSGLKQAMRADGGALLRRVHSWCIGETAERRRVAAGLACCRAWCAAEMILEGEAPLDEALLLVELGARTLGDEALAPHAADLLCTLLPLLGGGADAADGADGGGGGGAAARRRVAVARPRAAGAAADGARRGARRVPAAGAGAAAPGFARAAANRRAPRCPRRRPRVRRPRRPPRARWRRRPSSAPRGSPTR